jgi:hypothetical protein
MSHSRAVVGEAGCDLVAFKLVIPESQGETCITVL